MVLELETAQQFFTLHSYLFTFHAVDASKETDILCYRQVFVERELLRHVTDMLLDLFMLRADVVAHHGACAAGWLVQTR